MAKTLKGMAVRKLRGHLSDAVEIQAELRANQRKNAQALQEIGDSICRIKYALNDLEGRTRAGKPK